jgi:hypothetical protein
MRSLGATAIAAVEEPLRHEGGALIDELLARPHFEAAADFASRLPTSVVAGLVGSPAAAAGCSAGPPPHSTSLARSTSAARARPRRRSPCCATAAGWALRASPPAAGPRPCSTHRPGRALRPRGPSARHRLRRPRAGHHDPRLDLHALAARPPSRRVARIACGPVADPRRERRKRPSGVTDPRVHAPPGRRPRGRGRRDAQGRPASHCCSPPPTATRPGSRTPTGSICTAPTAHIWDGATGLTPVSASISPSSRCVRSWRRWSHASRRSSSGRQHRSATTPSRASLGSRHACADPSHTIPVTTAHVVAADAAG